ncbi:carotenoid biosynthesis protein [Solicola sp. PLA-1-18]|uniref:carotenoid biosynthesis protein n=1 Tax=Solicola sp. PLA-1-18 TaxID=3380532 RepID=UPI003B78EFC8
MTAVDDRPSRVRVRGSLVAWGLAAAGVLVQMSFPFSGGGDAVLAVVVVVLLAGAALVHAASSRGARSALALLLVAGGGALVAEAVGVATGYPFGEYDYTRSLGASVLGVPLVVPLAWIMIAYPCLLAARRLTGDRPVPTVLLAAWTMTTWDVFLDPQMVDAGHWRWADPTPALPGVADVPLTNYAGWLVVSALLCALLQVLVARPRVRSADLMPHALLLWTFGSSVLANAVFFGRPPVALVGGLLMATVAVPLAVSLWRARVR